MEKGEPSWWNEALHHLKNDSIMADCIETYGIDGLKGRGDLFYTIVRSIIGQQISVIAAESIWNRFEAMVGSVTPEKVRNFTKEEIAAGEFSPDVMDTGSTVPKLLNDEVLNSALVERIGNDFTLNMHYFAVMQGESTKYTDYGKLIKRKPQKITKRRCDFL